MPRTLAECAAGALLRWRLNSRIRPRQGRAAPVSPLPPVQTERILPMPLSFLDGYKTYVIAVAMLLAGVSQLVGVELPSFDGQSAGHLIMEAFAVIFLRRGIKATS